MRPNEMIRQVFDVEDYFRVIVWYNLDYSLFHLVEEDLREAGITKLMLRKLWKMMLSGRAKAVTFSNIRQHVCVVLFNNHEDRQDYISSIVHEAEHVKQAMLRAYHVEDRGEPPAYTIGYLVSRMWEVFRRFLVNSCKNGKN